MRLKLCATPWTELFCNHHVPRAAWGVLAILFAVGVVTGTILSFEFGILWPRWMAAYGDVMGLPFAIEGFVNCYAVAYSADTGARNRGGRRVAANGPAARIARVAPNVRTNAGSATDNGSAASRHTTTQASAFSGGLRWSAARAAR